MRKFYFLFLTIFCFCCLCGCGCGDGSSNISAPAFDATIPEGTAILEVSTVFPKESTNLGKRFSGNQEVPFEIIEARITVTGEDMDTPIVADLTISAANGFPKAHGKISVQSSELISRCAVITAKSNYGHEFVSQKECFLAQSQQRIPISFTMSPEQGGDSDAIVEIAELNWLWLVPETFLTIGQAMAVAKAGDTVRINGGTYLENISMKTGVIIEGVNNPVIKYDPENSNGYILVGAVDSQVRGITFHGGSSWHSGLLLYPGMKVGHNVIKDMPDLAMKIDTINSGEPVEIFNNIIIGGGCCDRGIKLYEGPNACDVLIYNNTILDVNEGVIFEMSYGEITGMNYRKIWNNVFCGCQWVCYAYSSDKLRNFVDLGNIFYRNVYYDWGYDGMVGQAPFMESSDSSGNYYSYPFTVDSSNKEIDPKFNADYAPTNPAVCGIGKGGVTPGARECVVVQPVLRWSADTPTGVQSVGEDMRIAIVEVVNPSSERDLTIKSLTPSFSGQWLAGGKRQLRIYDGDCGSLLYSGEWDPGVDIQIADAEFADVVVPPNGGTKKLIFTLDTWGICGGDCGTGKTVLQVNFQADAILWSYCGNDGVEWTGANGLPLFGNALQFE